VANESGNIVGNCTKCGAAITIDHPYSWCIKCGEPLREDIIAHLPAVRHLKRKGEGKMSESKGKRGPEEALKRRYIDRYATANFVIGVGHFMEGFGIVAGIILLLISLSALANPLSALFGISGVPMSILVGVAFYVAGAMIDAQGKVLLAALDSAVNTSPFLALEQKAEIMSLPAPVEDKVEEK